MAPQSNYRAMNSLIRATAGQENIIGIPRLYIEYMDSLEGGVFLSQLIYWSDKGGRDDGWFYKTYQEWRNDIHLSEYEVRKWAKVMVAAGYLETKVMKANGDPTVHYRFNMDKFRESLIEFLSNQETEKVKEPKRKKKVSITENTSETTNRNNLRANDARAEPPQAMLPDSLTFDELGEIFADEFERITDSLEGEQQKQVIYAQESLLNDSPSGKDVSVIRTSSYSAPVAPRPPAKGKQSNPNTKPILDAYFSLLTYKPTNAGKEAKAAKALADDGYTPEQVTAAYRRMKSEEFWRFKHLSLAKVHENIGALLPALSPPGNGQRVSSRDGYTFLNV